MIVLGIDSSGTSTSCALTDDNRILGEYTACSTLKHSCTLLPMIESLFKSCNLTVDDVELFAINAGPGSFTGVRIGVSLIKGLTFGTDKPVVSVSTLEALSYNLRGFDGLICPVMDARRDQFYNALFKDGKRLCDDRLILANELEDELKKYDCPVYFAGDGTDLAKEKINLPNIKETPSRLVISSAVQTALCGYDQYVRGESVFTDKTIMPIYLRKSQATREREERLEKENGN